MKVEKRENLENRQVRLTVSVDSDLWKKALKDAYEGLKAQCPLEGEVTMERLCEKYGDAFLYQPAVNDTYPQALVEAIREENLSLAGTPSLTVEHIGADGFTFAAVIDLYPEVKLGQYKGLSAVYPQVELSNDDVEAAIAAYLQERVLPSTPEAAAMGDQVMIDFEGFVDGEAFEGGKAEMYPLVLGSGTFIPGFEEQLAGMKAGEERDITVTFPEAYVEPLAGKKAVFRIKLPEITRYTAPVLDDAFARAQDFADAAALRRDIMDTALKAKEMDARNSFLQELIQQVVDGMEAELPDSMVEGQLNGLMNDLAAQMQAQGMELQQYLEMAGLTMEDLRSRAREQAVASARFELAMMAIAEAENISVTQEELDREYAKMAQLYGMDAAEIRRQLPEVRLQHDMKIAKAQSVIAESAKRK